VLSLQPEKQAPVARSHLYPPQSVAVPSFATDCVSSGEQVASLDWQAPVRHTRPAAQSLTEVQLDLQPASAHA
jgi:hypothetical protein